MDYVALAGTNHFLHRRKRQQRLLLTSAIASLASIFFLLQSQDYMIYVLSSHFLLGPCMVVFSFGKARYREFLENWGVCYLMLLVLGGLWEALSRMMPNVSSIITKTVLGLFLFLMVVFYLARRKRYGERIYEVRLVNGEKSIQLKAYWDSGNRLRDCYTGQPVQILKKEEWRKLVGEEIQQIRLVPCCVIGKKNDLIKVVTIEEMDIMLDHSTKIMRPVTIGIAENGELEHTDFKMILHTTALE